MSRAAADRLPPLEARFSGQHPLRTLSYLYHGQRTSLLVAAVFYVIKHSPVWLMPVIIRNVVDLAASPGDDAHRRLAWNALVVGLLIVQNVPLQYGFVYYVSRAARTMEVELRSALSRRLQQLSIGYYARQSAGALQSKMLRDVEALEQLTRLLYDSGLSALTNIVFAIIVTALVQPWFLLFFAATVPVSVAIVYALRAPLRERNAALREQVEKMSARVIEMTHLIPITRAHGLETTALARVGESLEKLRYAGQRVDTINALFGAVSWATLNVFNMGALLVAGWACLEQWIPITPGDVVLIATYFGLIAGSVLGLVGTVPQITKGFESLRSIGEVLECPDLEQNEGKAPVPAVRGEFRFEQAGFAYPGSELAALRDFSLTVAPGETIAFVGPSGAGKSTVLNLVIGFIRPTSGRVRLDGVDMETYDLRSYRRHLAVVPQESILFEGTIRENVTYGLTSVPEERVLQALRDANAWEFIAKLPTGLDTPVGEKGARLSGGQKQRLAIARALIRDPRVLILDEATSALDTESESLIQEALARLMRGRTTFVVAHRLSTIRDAHRIVVLEQGRIVEVGRHDELLANHALYARLHAKQVGSASA